MRDVAVDSDENIVARTSAIEAGMREVALKNADTIMLV